MKYFTFSSFVVSLQCVSYTFSTPQLGLATFKSLVATELDLPGLKGDGKTSTNQCKMRAVKMKTTYCLLPGIRMTGLHHRAFGSRCFLRSHL
jgi:hypothetical protein